MNTVETKSKVTNRGAAWGSGLQASKSGGGPNSSKPDITPGSNRQAGGSALNRGRFKGGSEYHPDKQTVPSISQGSTNPSR